MSLPPLSPLPEEPGSGPAREGESESLSLREVFAERRISLSSMERGLRLATAGAGAGLLGSILLLVVVRLQGGGGVYLGRNAGKVTTISALAFSATLVLVAVGIAYVLTAAVLARARVMIPVLVVVTGGVGVFTGVFGDLGVGVSLGNILPGWVAWATRGVLLLVWVSALGVSRMERKQRMWPGLLGGYTLLLLAYLFVPWWTSPSLGGLNVYGPAISLELGFLVFVVYPFLQVASVDFGEWGELVGERVAGGKAWRSRVVGVVLGLALVEEGWRIGPKGDPAILSVARFTGLVPGLLVLLGGGVVLVLGALLFRRLSQLRVGGAGRIRLPRRLSAAALLSAAAVSLVIPWAGAKVVGDLTLGPRPAMVEKGEFAPGADVVSVSGGSGYSVLLPRGWGKLGEKGTSTEYLVGGEGGSLTMLAAELPGPASPQSVAQALSLSLSGESEQVGEGNAVGFFAEGKEGEVWVYTKDTTSPVTSYVVKVEGEKGVFQASKEEVHAILTSFRGAGESPVVIPPAVEEKSDAALVAAHQARERAIDVGITSALVVVGLVLAGLFSWGEQVVGGILVLGVTDLFQVMYFLDELGRSVGERWAYLGEASFLLGVGVAGMLALVVRSRKVLRGVVALMGGVLVLEGMGYAYSASKGAAGVHGVWGAALVAGVVLVAVGWEVLMSGESLTNRHTLHFPRHTRVLGFMGYTLLTTSMVLFYGAQFVVASGERAEPEFEAESVTSAALLRFALPVLVLLFLLSLGRRRIEEVEAGAGEVESGGAESGGAGPRVAEERGEREGEGKAGAEGPGGPESEQEGEER